MKKIPLLITLLFTIVVISQNQKEYSQINQVKNTGFIKNEGQIIDQNGNENKKALYLLNTNGLNVQLKKSGFSYDVYERISDSSKTKTHISENTIFNQKELFINNDSLNTETLFHRIDFEFLDISDKVVIKEYDAVSSFSNYYNLPNKQDGISYVKSFKKIVYENLYEGINVEFFVPKDINKPVEYNFIILPTGDISNIKMNISGTEVNLINNALNMRLSHGYLNEIIPRSWIKNNDNQKEVTVNYSKQGENIFGFQLKNDNHNKTSTLVIDPTPVRSWATYFGGSDNESYFGGDVESDSNGNVYLSGYTQSNTNIATSGSHQSSLIQYPNAYLAKFNSCGTIIWATYYGGNGTTFSAITVDYLDNVIAVGDSGSKTNISTTGTYQETKNSSKFGDGIIVKFNSNGVRLWGTYYGGESADGILSVKTDVNQNIYFGGTTASNEDIATVGAFKEIGNVNVHNNWDAFLGKMDKNGVLQWATYYGDDGHEDIHEIGIDSFGFIYFTGTTSSFNEIATAGAYQEDFSYDTMLWNDAYLVKFDSNGNRIWGTYFGGYDYDFGHGLTIDSQNNVIISGNTRSNEKIASVNTHQQNKGGAFDDWDAFLAKFNENGNLLWSTYYGGNDWEDWGYFEVDVDANDNVFLAGSTRSTNKMATTNTYQENLSAYSNLFVAKFDALGKREWGTYYGGNIADYASGIEVTNLGEIYAIGWTYSTTGIASSDGHQEFHAGQKDAFLVKFKDVDSPIHVDVAEIFLCTGEDISFNISGGISYTWSGPNGFASTEQNPTIKNANINNSGTYSVIIESGDGCFNTRKFEILISEKPIANPIADLITCEDIFSTGLATNIDTSNLEPQIIGNQTAMIVRYFDSNGNELPNPLPNPFKNINAYLETITARIYNNNNLECYSETTFDLIVNPLPDISNVNDLTECETNNDGLAYFNLEQLKTDNFGTNTNYNVSFYQANGTLIPKAELPTYKNATINEETITLKVENIDTNCTNEATFKLIVNPLPIANPLTEIIGCDDNADGISEYFDTSNVETEVLNGQTGMEVSYFDGFGNQLSSPLPNPYTNTKVNQETITLRVTNPQTGCYSETLLNLITSSKPQINQLTPLFACDEANGIAYFDTSAIENQLIGNQSNLLIFYSDENGNELPSPLPATYQNSTAWAQTIQVRVENELNSLCYSETSLELIVNELPQINLENDYFLCDLEPSLNISTDSTFDSWEWSFEDGSVISNTFDANLTDAGIYTLWVYKIIDGISCENSFSFNLIRSVLPKIDEVKIQDISDNNTIEIITSGDGDFEYSMDGFNFQDNNTFHNLLGGIYNIQVRDKKGCGSDIKEIVLVDYPRFFTPNNDGYNDYWQIQGVEIFPNTVIFIFDRFGKLLKKLTTNDLGWDGTYNGKFMDPSDYWFTADLGDGRNIKGHFSLVR